MILNDYLVTHLLQIKAVARSHQMLTSIVYAYTLGIIWSPHSEK
jgi:hypothetical protein